MDIVAVSRMERWRKCPGLLNRFFHPSELAEITCKGGEPDAERLAARFAAKEAFGKALGSGMRGIKLSHIQVSLATGGRPILVVEGTALEALSRSCGERVHLTITHEGGVGVALIILEA